MRRWTRALTTLLAASAAGFLLWFAPHFNRSTTGGYWGVIGLVTLAGVLIGCSQLHGRDGNPTASFLVAFVPVFVAAGWVIVAFEPKATWVRDHVLSWSGELGIGHAVHNLGEHVVVLAFGLGVVFGLTFELRMLRRRGSKQAQIALTIEPPLSAPEPVPVDSPPENPTVVEPPAEAWPEDSAVTREPAGPSRKQGSTEPGSEEPTVVATPADRQESAVLTVEQAGSSTPPESAELAAERPETVGDAPTAVASPDDPEQKAEQGPPESPA